jgi:hypothetical protein
MDVVLRDDARKIGNPTHELTELVVAPGDPDLDRQLHIEIGRLLIAGLEQLEFQAGPEPLLRDVDQKARDLGLVRKPLEHVTERLLDVFELRRQGIEIDDLGLLALQVLFEHQLLLLDLFEEGGLVLQVDVPAGC